MAAKILIVEDNEQNLYMMSFILKNEGFSTIQAKDGKMACKLALAELPDLVIMDMQLPKMDGYKAACKINNREETANIPIIAVTAYAMKGDRDKALKAGCTGYIKKPIDPQKFVIKIRKYLAQK